MRHAVVTWKSTLRDISFEVAISYIYMYEKIAGIDGQRSYWPTE